MVGTGAAAEGGKAYAHVEGSIKITIIHVWSDFFKIKSTVSISKIKVEAPTSEYESRLKEWLLEENPLIPEDGAEYGIDYDAEPTWLMEGKGPWCYVSPKVMASSDYFKKVSGGYLATYDWLEHIKMFYGDDGWLRELEYRYSASTPKGSISVKASLKLQDSNFLNVGRGISWYWIIIGAIIVIGIVIHYLRYRARTNIRGNTENQNFPAANSPFHYSFNNHWLA